jgi:hypothetical protein
MIRITYSTGEIAEYSNAKTAAMEATQAIVASQGLIVPIRAVEVWPGFGLLGETLEKVLKVKLGLVEFHAV